MSIRDESPDDDVRQVLDPAVLARHDAVRARLATYRKFVAEVAEGMARVRAETHTGHDEAEVAAALPPGYRDPA